MQSVLQEQPPLAELGAIAGEAAAATEHATAAADVLPQRGAEAASAREVERLAHSYAENARASLINHPHHNPERAVPSASYPPPHLRRPTTS